MGALWNRLTAKRGQYGIPSSDQREDDDAKSRHQRGDEQQTRYETSHCDPPIPSIRSAETGRNCCEQTRLRVVLFRWK